MTEKILSVPASLKSDFEGYDFLTSLCKVKSVIEKTITFDFDRTDWLDAHCCSPLAAIIFQLLDKGKIIRFINIRPHIKDILKRNNFSHHFMGTNFYTLDQSSIISCSKFYLKDTSNFQLHVDKDLLSKPGFPKISLELRKKINKSILEIFNNAHIHGHCDCVYTCGQYYPHSESLHFTISDMGQTIRKNVNGFLTAKKTGAQSIEWAVEEGNTTKTGMIPGGLGISLIRDFLKLNEGGIEIVSSNGYWHEEKGQAYSETLKSNFLGTIVNLKFNLADKNIYILASEIDSTKIW